MRLQTEPESQVHATTAERNYRVLHVLDHSWPLLSGYSVRSRSIVRAQQALGHDVSVVTGISQQVDDPASADSTFDGIAHYRTPIPTGIAGSAIRRRIPILRELSSVIALRRRIRQVMREGSFDAVHAHSPALCGLAAYLAARPAGIPVLYEIRGFWEESAVTTGRGRRRSWRYHLTRWLESFVARRSSGVIGISQAIVQDLHDRGLPRHKMFCVPNGVESERFPVPPRDTRLAEELRLPAGQTVFGFIGSMWRFEGIPWLVEATAELRRRGFGFQLLIIGHGEDAARVEERISKLGVSDFVRFLGRIPHERIGCYYSLMDVLVYPRHRLPVTEKVTPLKPLEAMAQCKVVLGSDVGGLRELVEPEVNGLLFKADDVEDFCLQASRLISDSSLRSRLAASGRESVLRERDWRQLARRYGTIYEKAVQRP